MLTMCCAGTVLPPRSIADHMESQMPCKCIICMVVSNPENAEPAVGFCAVQYSLSVHQHGMLPAMPLMGAGPSAVAALTFYKRFSLATSAIVSLHAMGLPHYRGFFT